MPTEVALALALEKVDLHLLLYQVPPGRQLLGELPLLPAPHHLLLLLWIPHHLLLLQGLEPGLELGQGQ